MEYVGIFISGIALGVAFWQGYLSKQQLEQAKETKSDIEKLLVEVKDKVNKIETISDETRKDIREQITKLIDKQDENLKTLINNPAKSEQNQMMMQLLVPMLQNPDSLKTLMELSKSSKTE